MTSLRELDIPCPPFKQEMSVQVLLLIMALFLTVTTWAQETFPNTSSVPTTTTTTTIPENVQHAEFKRINGQPQLFFKDGRIAAFYQSIGKVMPVVIPMRQIENTCDYQQNLSNCRLKLDAASFYLSARWLQHPDSAKIGKVAEARFIFKGSPPQAFEPLRSSNTIFTWMDTQLFQSYKSSFKPDVIECDQLDWTKQITEKDSLLQLQSWSAEFMLENPETKVNENLSPSAIYDLKLKKLNNTSLEFVSFGPSKFSFIEYIAPYLSQQIVNLSFLNAQGDACQTSFEMNLSAAQKLLQDPKFLQEDPQTVMPVPASLSANKGFLQMSFYLKTLVNEPTALISVEVQ